jgi:hypothetical protein
MARREKCWQTPSRSEAEPADAAAVGGLGCGLEKSEEATRLPVQRKRGLSLEEENAMGLCC